MTYSIDEYFNLFYNGEHCGNMYKWLNTEHWKYQTLNWAWPIGDGLPAMTTDEIVKLVNVKHRIINPKTHRLVEYELKLYKAGIIETKNIIFHQGYLLFRYRPTHELVKMEYNIRLIKISEIKKLTDWKLIKCNNYKENGKLTFFTI